MKGRRAGTGIRRFMVAALVSVVAPLAVLVCSASPAAAHASLIGSSPAEGSTIKVAPTKVVLRFDENIRAPSVVIVDAPDGGHVNHGSTTVVDNTATVQVRVTAPGRYTVAYRVISSDGHPVAARTSFTFEGKAGSAAVTRAPQPAKATADNTRWVVGGAAVAVLVAAGLLLTSRVRRSGGRR